MFDDPWWAWKGRRGVHGNQDSVHGQNTTSRRGQEGAAKKPHSAQARRLSTLCDAKAANMWIFLPTSHSWVRLTNPSWTLCL